MFLHEAVHLNILCSCGDVFGVFLRDLFGGTWLT